MLYSLLMEFCVWRIMGVNAPAVLVSALLGLLCGFSTVVFGERYFLEPVLFVGFAAGLMTGLVLYYLKKGQPAGDASSSPVGVVA